MLQSHPDTRAVDFIIQGLRDGFSLGCTCEIQPAQPNNLRSATDNAEAVTQAFNKELENNHICGPYSHPPMTNLHCSPVGSRPKKDGTVRLILDLSQPEGNSVNAGIDKEDYSVHFETFDCATDIVKKLGQGTFLAKIDIKSAFRLLPVRPSEWFMLGMHWMGAYFVDCHLPFGCRSSPFIFSVFSDLVAWLLEQEAGIPNITHYLDDYLLACNSDESTASRELDAALRMFGHLRIPIAYDKLVRPTTKLTYLGIDIDTSGMLISLPADKLHELKQALPMWLNRKKCTKRELLSLIGKLAFATKVVRPGRTFLRRLIDLSMSAKKLHHHIDLNTEARKDIRWWIEFLPNWNGRNIIIDTQPSTSTIFELYTDASDIGFGIYFDGHWVSEKWPEFIGNDICTYNIDFRELFAIYAAIIIFAGKLSGRQVIIHTDNLPIVHAWHKGSSTSHLIMSLTRSILMIAANNEFAISLQHIPGVRNEAADALSRLKLDAFQRLMPSSDPQGTVVPSAVWEWASCPY